MWVAWPLATPPPPLVPCPGTGARGDQKGGWTTASQLPAHMLRRGFPTALIHHNMTMPVTYLMDNPSPQREHLCKRKGAGVQCSWVATGLGAGGGMTHERGASPPL